MKHSNQINTIQDPNQRSYSSALGRIAATVAALFAMGVYCNSLAQSDDFNDGNDTSPVAWMHYDAMNAIFGGPPYNVPPQDSWTFPGGNTYRLQASPSPLPGTIGPGRVSSFPTNIYTDFDVSVDVVNWNNSYSQAFGILARAGNFGTAGAPTTRGYMFIYVNGAVSAPGYDNFIAIARLQNDASTRGVHGSSGATAEVHGVTLDPANHYRFVLMAKGTHLEGRIYQLPDMHTPIAVVSANTAGEAVQHTSGQCGVFGFNVADAGGAPYAGPVDVTFDNYSAVSDAPSTAFADDFNDGNDTTPPPAWVHEDPIAEAGVPPPCYTGATFTFPSGAYRLYSPLPCVTAAGGPRVVSMRGESLYSDFYISVDALSWDDTVHQLFGIAARINTPGPGTTGGYLLTWEDGSAPLPNSTDGDFDLLRLQGEGQIEAYQMEHDVPNQNSGMHLTNGVSYRFVYIARGFNFEARIYALPDTTTPVKRIFAVDNLSLFPNGPVGLIVADHPSDNPFHACWAVFDNFYVSAAIPELAINGNSGFASVSWPASLDGIWVLEFSPAVGPGAVWTEITADQVVLSGTQNVHTEASPIDSSANTYFRLRKL